MTHSANAYTRAGVNLDAADAAKRAMRDAIRSTHGPQVLGAMGGFGGLFALDTHGLREPVLVSSIDGVAVESQTRLARFLRSRGRAGVVYICRHLTCQGSS